MLRRKKQSDNEHCERVYGAKVAGIGDGRSAYAIDEREVELVEAYRRLGANGQQRARDGIWQLIAGGCVHG